MLIDLLKKRKASRAISEEKLDDAVVDKLKQAAQFSASCANNQPWRFLFLTDEMALEKGRKALSRGNSWATRAPLLIIGFSKPDLDCRMGDGRVYHQFDLGMAVQLILLQATEMDLVARPMAGFSPGTIKADFHIPDAYDVTIMIAVGYEGDIDLLDEKRRRTSIAPRTRYPLNHNFFSNELSDSIRNDFEESH